jgi:hypothetical protein
MAKRLNEENFTTQVKANSRRRRRVTIYQSCTQTEKVSLQVRCDLYFIILHLFWNTYFVMSDVLFKIIHNSVKFEIMQYVLFGNLYYAILSLFEIVVCEISVVRSQYSCLFYIYIYISFLLLIIC